MVLRPGRAGRWRTRSTSSPARPAGKYGYVEAYRCEDADYILVGMGCYMETAKATVDYLRDEEEHQGRVPDACSCSARSRRRRSSTR